MTNRVINSKICLKRGGIIEQYKEKYRHELKYIMDARDAASAVFQIRHFMEPDVHYPEGHYRIRSVYFDDIWNTALMENLDGISPRSKYRIRIYNESKESIRLEQKIKNHDLTTKRSCSLSLEECRCFLRGDAGGIQEEDNRKVLADFRRKMLWNQLRPKIIIAYERTAFTYPEGNVRITFDSRLAFSGSIQRFWEKALPKQPVMADGEYVMEVKYDEFLPGCIRQILNTGKMERTKFSKYTMCRMKNTTER